MRFSKPQQPVIVLFICMVFTLPITLRGQTPPQEFRVGALTFKAPVGWTSSVYRGSNTQSLTYRKAVEDTRIVLKVVFSSVPSTASDVTDIQLAQVAKESQTAILEGIRERGGRVAASTTKQLNHQGKEAYLTTIKYLEKGENYQVRLWRFQKNGDFYLYHLVVRGKAISPVAMQEAERGWNTVTGKRHVQNRLTEITEQPSGAVTSFTYDDAGRLLTETRTGTNPYSGTYTYDVAGRRSTALVVTNGMTTHNGTYSYDNAGRLTQVVDAATGQTEVYTWNANERRGQRRRSICGAVRDGKERCLYLSFFVWRGGEKLNFAGTASTSGTSTGK